MSRLSEMNPNFVGCNCGVQEVPLVSNTSDVGQRPIFSVCKKGTLGFELATRVRKVTWVHSVIQWHKCQQRSDRGKSCYLLASKTVTCCDEEESLTAFGRQWLKYQFQNGILSVSLAQKFASTIYWALFGLSLLALVLKMPLFEWHNFESIFLLPSLCLHRAFEK